MEMVVVPVIGPHLAQPVAIASARLAELLLDPGRDEDALHPRVERGAADQPAVRLAPAVGIDLVRSRLGELDRGDVLALLLG